MRLSLLLLHLRKCVTKLGIAHNIFSLTAPFFCMKKKKKKNLKKYTRFVPFGSQISRSDILLIWIVKNSTIDRIFNSL